MSHPLIASFSVACLVGALPLAAHATDDTALAAPNPLRSSADLTHGRFSMLRVNAGTAQSGAQMAPVIHGPDFVPKWSNWSRWQARAVSPDAGGSKLNGDRFRFR